ncbi:MAG: ATP-binding protein, partial [Bacteroidota bacterium]
ETAREANVLLNDMITQVRDVSHELLPNELIRFGLVAAIEDHCERLAKLNHLDVAFVYDQSYDFPKMQKLSLYRIIQELTNNTLKHAEASQIEIKLRTEMDMLLFTYRDNGKGFDQTKLQTKKMGLGLKSIESRASMLGGEVVVQSALGSGFQVSISWPARESITHKDRGGA